MHVVCLDMEGVLVPEIWIRFAERTGIEALRATTRDVPDYDDLMRQRLAILAEHGLGILDIQSVIGGIEPLPGARDFLDRLRARAQVVILSDTFYQFAKPLMERLGWPTLLCNRLVLGEGGRVLDYRIRQPDQKRQAVRAFRELRFRTVAVGDSYNDTAMLGAADQGIFFRPPSHIARQFPGYPVVESYPDLDLLLDAILGEGAGFLDESEDHAPPDLAPAAG